MQKTSVLLACLLAFSCSLTSACPVSFVASQDIKEAIAAKKTNWVIADESCKALAKNNLGLSIATGDGVIAGVSYAWAHVAIMQLNSRVTAPHYSTITKIDSGNASSPRARELLLAAISEAIQQFDMQNSLDYFDKTKQLHK
jgi:hypothetical protein